MWGVIMVVDIYLSYHRADDKYQKAVEQVIKDLKIPNLGNIYTIQNQNGNNNNQRWWLEINEQIRTSVVVFLVTEGWFAHRQYDMRVTLHHDRPFIILYCHPGVYASKDFPV